MLPVIIRLVAYITLCSSRTMISLLASCNIAIVTAGATARRCIVWVVNYGDIVTPIVSTPVTGTTIVTSTRMIPRLGMTGTTGINTQYLVMIHRYDRRPTIRGVAGFAHISGVNVITVFIAGVTGSAIANDLSVIDSSDVSKITTRIMAGLTVITGFRMIGTLGVTGSAIAQDLCMVYRVWIGP